jgi:hypothetical protein
MDGLGEWPLFPEATGWEDAAAVLEDHGLGDGLPMVPPTPRRMNAMLEDAAPARSFGQMPPLFGELTAAAAAYQCVLAGCSPGALPLVLCAAEACLEPPFNLLGILTTTGAPAVAAIVHGPIARALGMNASTNCLGPGNRANATLGRALALVMTNIAGARPGVGDMATMGQPGKYGFCLPEGDDETLPGLAHRRGLAGDAVTVLGVSGTAEVLPGENGDAPEDILGPMAAAMASARAVASAGRERALGEQFFLLPPELARQITKRGWDLDRIRDFIFASGGNARAPEDIHPIVTGGPGVKMTYLPLWAGGTLSVTKTIRNLGS